jgi:hypothetical protein
VWPTLHELLPADGARTAAAPDLILGALEYAVWTRNIGDQEVIHHSDRGSNYTSLRFSQRLADHGIVASMGNEVLPDTPWTAARWSSHFRIAWFVSSGFSCWIQ